MKCEKCGKDRPDNLNYCSTCKTKELTKPPIISKEVVPEKIITAENDSAAVLVNEKMPFPKKDPWYFICSAILIGYILILLFAYFIGVSFAIMGGPFIHYGMDGVSLVIVFTIMLYPVGLTLLACLLFAIIHGSKYRKKLKKYKAQMVDNQ